MNRPTQTARSVRATVLQTPTPDDLQVLEDQLIVLDENGRIISIGPASDGTEADVVLPSTQVLLPGLIDMHIHAPQWPQLGTGLDLPLDRWLFERTFPTEARFSDELFARTAWAQMVPTLLAHGTTTAVYYSSIDETATTALAEACLRYGQRAFVGRVAMDHPEGTPEWYRDASATAAVEASARSIEDIVALDRDGLLVQPIITPRFIPACSDSALEGFGELAASTGVRVQTHCSEGDWEHSYVLDRHGMTDTASLSSFGLLGDHTVLAHATHLTDSDRRLIAESGAGVAHCPISNSYFANAVFPLRRNLDAGVRVGLGTDIAGGSKVSLFTQCEHAVTVSRMLEDGVDVEIGSGRGVSGSRIDAIAAFWCATGGGAELLGIEAGLLAPTKAFDAVAIDLEVLPSFHSDWDHGDWHRVFEKIVRGVVDRTGIDAVWVGGRRVV